MTHLHVFYAAVLAITLVATVTDYRRGLIPNWLTLPALVIAPLAHGLSFGWNGALFSLLGIAVCGATPLLFHRLGAMGGGDVKLFAAIGALCGPSMGLEIELLALSTAFGFGLCVMAWRGQLWRTLRQTGTVVRNAFVPQAKKHELGEQELTSLRIGAAIFAGSCLAVLDQAVLGGMLR